MLILLSVHITSVLFQFRPDYGHLLELHTLTLVAHCNALLHYVTHVGRRQHKVTSLITRLLAPSGPPRGGGGGTGDTFPGPPNFQGVPWGSFLHDFYLSGLHLHVVFLYFAFPALFGLNEWTLGQNKQQYYVIPTPLINWPCHMNN